LLHDVLEVADVVVARGFEDPAEWASQPAVATLFADAARTRGIDRKFLPHAARLAHRMLTGSLVLTDGNMLPSLAAAPSLAREIEFAYPLDDLDQEHRSHDGFVRGFIDALVAWDDEELWIVDYKSDVLAGTDLVAAARARVEQHYAVQARLYSIAVDRMRGRRRLAGMLYAFMRHDIVVPWRVDEDNLATWRGWLADVAVKVARSKEAS
jgi:ATP-dependent exoDNAse (exonuclease V) beta subunit